MTIVKRNCDPYNKNVDPISKTSPESIAFPSYSLCDIEGWLGIFQFPIIILRKISGHASGIMNHILLKILGLRVYNKVEASGDDGWDLAHFTIQGHTPY